MSPLLVVLISTVTSPSLEVFADIRPVAQLVREVGGRHVHVGTLVPGNADPHVFEPTPRQMVALSAARLYFSADLPLDRQIHSRIGAIAGGPVYVDATAGIEKRAFVSGPGCGHSHDHETADLDHGDSAARQDAAAGGAGGHGPADPHVWLSPSNLRVMAENVAAALEKADPSHAADYRANLRRFLQRVEATDRAVGRRLAPHRGKSFYVLHPALGYLAERYGLIQCPVQFEGRTPSPRRLRALIKQAQADHVRVVFSQSQFDRRPAQIIAGAIGAEVVTIDPLAADVLGSLDKISRQLADAMKSQAERP